MSTNRPAFVWSPDYEIDIGRHVFPTSKFRRMKEQLVAEGLVREGEIELAPRATDAELLTVLEPEYLADLRGYKHTARTMRSELPITRQIVESMVVTTGGTILAARRALARGGACHFGGGYHHAFADHAEGFCYINDIAIAARVLLNEGKVRRVAVIDIDVHQGNGTATIFEHDPAVFTFSIHEENLYPFEKQRSSLDIGLPANPGQKNYLHDLERGVTAALDEFRPDLVFCAAGVDPYEGDQLGRLRLTWETMRRRDEVVLRRAVALGIPFVTVVSGGYAVRLEDTVGLHAQTVAVAMDALREGAKPS